MRIGDLRGGQLGRVVGPWRAAWLQMDRAKDGLVTRLVEDREKLFAHLDRVTRAAPELIENARDVLERAITFQQTRFEEYMSRADGKRELEARAFAEYQKTKRGLACCVMHVQVRGRGGWR